MRLGQIMGEAKRAAAAWGLIQEGLSPDQKVIADTARAVWTRFVEPARATGMCYRLTLFLTEYLQSKHDIVVEPVIGFGHDRTGPLMMSHGWIEHDGLVTDISLGVTEHPDVNPPGEVLIMGRAYRPGHRYDYHRLQDAAALEALAELASHSEMAAVVKQKDMEHRFFSEIAGDPLKRRAYLDAAPDGLNFDRLMSVVGLG